MSDYRTETGVPERNMEFTLDEEQQSVVELAAEIFGGLSDDESHVVSERTGEAYDPRLWDAVTDAGLVEALLPVDGEPGLGTVGLTLLAREQGRYLARIPLVPTAAAALTLAEFGGGGGVLANVLDGSARIAVLLAEERGGVTGVRADAGWVLNGSIELGYLVPSASHLLVQVATDQGPLLAVLAIGRAGILVDPYLGLSGLAHAAVELRDVSITADDLVGDANSMREAHAWLRHRLLAAMAGVTAGACAEAVRRTAIYTSEREQFGRPLSTNQGVALRAADAHIDSEAIWLTAIDAAWQLDHGADGLEAALIASWWASEAGFRVVHATQHLHGGMGADVDNHIHRFFTWVRETDVVWGSSGALLDQISAVILPEEHS